MALYQRDPKDENAKDAWDDAVARLDRYAPGDLKLLNLRNEAAQLLGLAEQAEPATDDDTQPAPK